MGKRLYVDKMSSRCPSRSYSRSRSKSRDRKAAPRVAKKPTSKDQCFICKEFGHWYGPAHTGPIRVRKETAKA